MSTLILYSNCKITPQKNFKVENIGYYLDTLTKTTITKFQYVKQALTLEIKVDLSQTYIDYNATRINYASIQNTNGKLAYYFITAKEWRGEDTIKLTLLLDTINTFLIGTDYDFNDKTKVNRQHKDRFIHTDTYGSWSQQTITPGDYGELEDDTEYRIVSQGNSFVDNSSITSLSGGEMYLVKRSATDNNTLISKQRITAINFYYGYMVAVNSSAEIVTETATDYDAAPYFYSIIGKSIIVDQSGEDNLDAVFQVSSTKGYLRKIDLASEGVNPVLYGTNKEVIQDDNQSWYLVYRGNNPIRLYVCADNSFSITIRSSRTISVGDLSAGTYYYILPDRNNNEVFLKTIDGEDVSAKIYYGSTGDFSWREQYVTRYHLSSGKIVVERLLYLDYGLGFFYSKIISSTTTSQIVITSNLQTIYYNYSSTITTNTAIIRNLTSASLVTSSTTYVNSSFAQLDRSDEKLVKVIKLPYKPIDNFDSFKYDDSTDDSGVTMNMIYLDNPSILFDYDFVSTYNPLEDLELDLPSSKTSVKRSDVYESKLYHSDFYQPKFIYDSFSYIFSLQLINLDTYIYSSDFNIRFSVTNTINSRMMFAFANYNTDTKTIEDYSSILIVSRNNEVPIFTSAYESYVKNGYNYDVKTKERQEAGLWLGTGLSLAGSVVSFASTIATGGAGIVAGISLATSTMAQLTSAVNTTAQSEQNMQQRLHQLRLQKESVYGADDVDLMTRYTGNKAKFMLYQTSERMHQALYDLFFYTGYVDGTNHVPDYSSRVRFNFVSCDPVLDIYTNLPDDVIEDIMARYNAGVTFLHEFNQEWDFEQEYENWEVSIY